MTKTHLIIILVFILSITLIGRMFFYTEEDEEEKALAKRYSKKNLVNLPKEKELHSLAQALLDYETIDSDQLSKVLKGESLTSSDEEPFKDKDSFKKRKRRTSSTTKN